MNPDDNEKISQKFNPIREKAEDRRKKFRERPVPKIHIGLATCGIASGAIETKNAFEETLAQRNVEALIHTVGCLGHCYAEPVVVIDHPDSGFPPIFYPEVTPGQSTNAGKAVFTRR
jgi:NADH-quinone oxidoreductase subunit F